MKQSELEAAFETQYLRIGKHELVQEHRFAPAWNGKKRQWRFDFAHLDAKVAIECEGGVWSGGRHVTGSGFTKDCEKYNAATSLGWAVLRYPGKVITDDPASVIAQIDRLIDDRLPVASSTTPEIILTSSTLQALKQADTPEGKDRTDPATEWWNNIHRMWSPVQPAIAIVPKPAAAAFAIDDMVIVEGFGCDRTPRRITRVAMVGDRQAYGVDIGGGCSWLRFESQLSKYVDPSALKEAS